MLAISRISLSKVSVGSVLAEDARGPGGRLIVAANTPLTSRHLLALQTWGICEVAVVSRETTPQIASGLSAAESAELRERFVHHDLSHPLSAMLLRICEEERRG